MFLSNDPSSGDINSSNLSRFYTRGILVSSYHGLITPKCYQVIHFWKLESNGYLKG